VATNPSTWHVSDLLLRIDATPYDDPHALVCPNFQRGPVWGNAKKQAFIRSARSGWPVGTLLVHDEPRSVGNNVHHVYQLVDGLQRTVTLREYERAPFTFLSTDQYSQEHLSTVRTLLAAAFPTQVLPADEVDDAFVAWLKEKKSTSLAAGYTQNELYEYLSRTFKLGEGSFDSPSWGELLTNVEAHVSLASYSIPVLEYDGPAAHLHTIFELVNKGGLQLTKYQVVGSSWNTRLCTISNADIRNRIHHRYAEIQRKSGIKIPSVPSQASANGYPLFDYMFGLGRWLEGEFPLPFGNTGSPEDVHGIAFTLTCVAHGLPLSRLETLPQRLLTNQTTGEIDLSAFEVALKDSCQFVDRALKDMMFQVLDHAGMNRRMHTDYMIFAMVSSMLANKYDNSHAANGSPWRVRDSWTAAAEDAFRKALRRRYVLEIVKTREWSGTGDKLLFERVWDKDAGGYPSHPATHYSKSPSQRELREQLDFWWGTRSQEQYKYRVSRIDKVDALLLRLGAMRRLAVHTVAVDRLEVEHLLPVQRVQQLIRSTAVPGLPFNAAPNYVLLDADLNRRKRARTLGEYHSDAKKRWDEMPEERRGVLQKSTGPERWDVPENIEKHVKMMLLYPTTEEAFEHFSIAKDGDGHDAWTAQDFTRIVNEYWPLVRDEVLAVLW
jgi:hypothetical protein